MSTPWPPLYKYAMAHRCPTCGAEPGVDCDAPNKNARIARADQIAASAGMKIKHDPIKRIHATRQCAGSRHRDRDIARAPWPEDRVQGHRYDSLGTDDHAEIAQEPAE